MRAGPVCCALAAALFAPDAFAWGLQTHVFLAQWLLTAAPFADPQIRAAVGRFPRLVLAGACLPDLALAGRALRLCAFRRAHQWSTLRRLAATCWDEERALAVGYASHLLADVVAHNHFVPEHERRILDVPHVTHAICEWAVDEHLRPALEAEPAALLREEPTTLTQAAARTFGCTPATADSAIRFLATAERALRWSRMPAICRRSVTLFRREEFLNDACGLLRQVEAVLQGAEPRLQPEPDQAMVKEPPAMSAPSAPPAITSLG